MELTVIGSGTVAPSAERAGPSYWVSAGEVRLMLDCGAGALHRAAAAMIPWQQVTHVAISHFHVDHWGELPALLVALRWGIEPPRAAPLALLGPAGLRSRLVMLAGAFGDWIAAPDYALDTVELEPGEIHSLGNDVTLETFKTRHAAHSLAYAVRHRNARLVYTGDTGPSDELAEWASGCDLLLAECSLPDERAESGHLTPSNVAGLANAAHPRQLVLTHLYPWFDGSEATEAVARAFKGPVMAARDGDRFYIGEVDLMSNSNEQDIGKQ